MCTSCYKQYRCSCATLEVVVKSNSSNVDVLISFYNCSDFIEQTIIYGQLMDLSRDNRCALHVITGIRVPLP